MNKTEILKEKLENLSNANYDLSIFQKMNENEKLRFQKEKERKEIQAEDDLLQNEFQDILKDSVLENKKLLGYIKRYVLIGMITGVPGIAIAYLVDVWQENKMVKELYRKNIEAIANSDNKQLYKEYEIMQKKFNRVYKIDKIEEFIKSSREVEKLKSDNKAIKKLSDEIENYREEYEKSLKYYFENRIKTEKQEKLEKTAEDEELEQELGENKI